MTRGEMLAHNAGVASFAALAKAAAEKLNHKLMEKPTRYVFAIEALNAIADASDALIIPVDADHEVTTVDGVAPAADQPQDGS